MVCDAAGHYALHGVRCRACGAVIAGERLACPACGARDSFDRIELSTAGTVRAHTVVHRSFPGVKTPFVAVVVDLDGGGAVRGTLIDVDPLGPVPAHVKMVFRDSGQQDKQGKPFISYMFVPSGGAPDK